MRDFYFLDSTNRTFVDDFERTSFNWLIGVGFEFIRGDFYLRGFSNGPQVLARCGSGSFDGFFYYVDTTHGLSLVDFRWQVRAAFSLNVVDLVKVGYCGLWCERYLVSSEEI